MKSNIGHSMGGDNLFCKGGKGSPVNDSEDHAFRGEKNTRNIKRVK